MGDLLSSKLRREQRADAMQFGAGVGLRQAGDLGDVFHRQAFEVEHEDLAVQRLEPLHQRVQRDNMRVFVDDRRRRRALPRRSRCRRDLQVLRDTTPPRAARAVDRGVVRHPIDPGAQRTASAEGREAAPQGNVNLLQQVLLH